MSAPRWAIPATLRCDEGITDATLLTPTLFDDYVSWPVMLATPVALTIAGRHREFPTLRDCLETLGERGFTMDLEGITGIPCDWDFYDLIDMTLSEAAGLAPQNLSDRYAVTGGRW